MGIGNKHIILEFPSNSDEYLLIRSKMNMKVLVQTLIEIPDRELLAELYGSIVKHKAIVIPDINRYFHMLSCLFSGADKQVKLAAIEMYRHSLGLLLNTEAELSWNGVSVGVIRMAGEEDAELRKKARDLMVEVIDKTNNANIVLEKLYYEGLENESVLSRISAMRAIYAILELYPTLLQNKTSVRVVKLILEMLIQISIGSKHIELEKNAKQFLNKLFYLKIEKLDEVLTLMNDKLLEHLEALWLKNKEKMMQRDIEEGQQEMNRIRVEVKYEHMPLINGKFFGVYEPYVLKNIFNPDVPAARYLAIAHFREVFEGHYEQLQKYVNIIFKVIMKFSEGQHYDLLLMLKRIVCSPGVSNIVNLSLVPGALVGQLACQNVPYRRQLRAIFQKLNFEVPRQSLQAYEEYCSQNKQMNWIELYEVIGLLEHWVDNNMEASYPPTLDKMLETICPNLNSPQAKVREKALDVLLLILDRYPGYRENLENHFPEQKIFEIEDMIEARKNKGRGTSMAQEAEEIFMREYEEERNRFVRYQQEKNYRH